MKKDLAVKETESLAVMPNYLRHEGKPVGLEEMTRADWTLPRLGLCQSMSPQRKRSDPKYIEGLEEGDLFNSITRENYGKTVQVVPLIFFKNRFRFQEGQLGQVLCQSADDKHGVGDPGGDCATCAMAQFGSGKGNAPACSRFYNYPSLILPKDGHIGLDLLVVASFKSSELKVARDWNALLRLRNTDTFAGIYEFTTVEQKNDLGSWFTRVVKPAGWVTEQMYHFARGAYDAVKETQEAGSLKVDLEHGDENEPGSNG